MHLVFLLTAAAAGGLLLQRLAVPGGLVVGAMVGAAAYNLVAAQEVVIPAPARSVAFVILGGAIGAGITRDTLTSLRASLLPAVLSAVLILLAGVAIAFLLRGLGIAPPGDVLATSPGALSTVSAVAAEHGVGAPQVALFHTVRVVLVLASLPLILTILPSDE